MRLHLLQKVLRLPQAALKRAVTGLLQLVLLVNRPARLARSGFVLPTTVLLVLMVVLTATALTYRSFTRSDMAISQREQQVISNAATPAIDRAKAKLEFLFQTDKRFPSGVPASDILADLMLVRSDDDGWTGRVSPLAGANDPYTLPDETRIDINRDGKLDNAWSFKADIDGKGGVGANELVVYSILVDDQATRLDPINTSANSKKVEGLVDQGKADALVTRTGPLAVTEASSACAGAVAEGGWQVVQQGNNSILQKNFQVNAFVANANNANRTFETLEFQQSRSAARANKWGAWFRYDLDVSPGPDFNWNGAMHTDGSFLTFAPGGNNANSALRSHMVSSYNSCLYSKESSEISVSQVDLDGDGVATPGKVVSVNGISTPEFQGQAIRGSLLTDDTTSNGVSTIHVWDQSDKTIPILTRTLTNTNDSVRTGANNNNVRPSDVAVNPLVLFTRDITQHINPSGWQRDPEWDRVGNDGFKSRERIINDKVARPFVDDFFRADNRWGPKPRYDSRDTSLDMESVAGATTGSSIVGLNRLTEETGGLDGYWERRANTVGMKLIVGERLELGNANGWNANPIASSTWSTARTQGDALYPPKILPRDRVGGNDDANPINNRYGRPHEYRQRKALRDNLAAVQGMVVYHYRINDGKFPAACMAMTAHPGTAQTIINSRTFNNYTLTTTRRQVDFLRGVGTNGWEFQFPAAFDTETEFAAQIANGQPLGNALRNLARFAGDPKGGAPSFSPVQDTDVHPASDLSMWGDFSPLRRIFTEYLDATSAVTYANLSPADQATLHSAACNLSLLAYNVDSDRLELESTITTNSTQLQNVSQQLGKSVQTIMDCLAANTASKTSACKSGNFDALPFLKTRADINAANATVWADPNIATVITADSLCPATGGNRDAAGFQTNCDSAEYFSTWKLADWTAFINLPNVSNSLSNAERATLIADLTLFAQRINTYYTAIRDRDLGFRTGNSTKAGIAYNPAAGSFVTWDGTTGLTAPVQGFAQGNATRVFGLGCDPNIFQSLSAKGTGGADNNVMLGLMACSELSQQPVRYPSLYYLFPLENHDHDGTGYHQQPDGTVPTTSPQTAEEYITDAYVKAVNPIAGNPSTYRIVGSNALTGISAIAAAPRSATPSTWTVPAASGTALTTPDTQPFDISIPGGGIKVPFLDKGVYNGRDQLNARVLDIDLEALTRSTTSGGDTWISADLDRAAEGVVYAFREDAVREDEIARPKSATATITSDFCQTLNTATPRRFNLETDAACRMLVEPNPVATANTFRDPPLADRGVSLKPVDFVPDPDRRVHGFRLRTASGSPADFSGPATIGSTTPGPRKVGMTFVTDNTVYIQGDFNPHSTNGSVAIANLLEEFTQKINGTPPIAFGAPFYNDRTTLNTASFATLTRDHWRPVEILADAITLLSSSFRDGSVEDGFIKALPASNGGGSSSYMNQNRPILTADETNWVREGGAGSPVWIDRNGTYYRNNVATGQAIRPFYDVYTTDAQWTEFTDDNDRRRNLQPAGPTFVNATFISGLVPQRPQQGYGGLHNFVRFLEDWDSDELYISGSFIQLNFSTSATGPFEHDAWQPGQDPDANQRLGYYVPPQRRWGYDVALLYLPPAPAARRFVNIGAPRSEYYRELPADDPYIVNLRCAKTNATNFVFAESIRGTCPA